MKCEMVARSLRHRGESDKPNEDCYLTDEHINFAALADGVTRSRSPAGEYPPGSTVAPQQFVHKTRDAIFREMPPVNNPKKIIREAFREANESIWSVNKIYDIPEKLNFDDVDYLGTTGCVFWMCDAESGKALLAFIGDVIALHIPFFAPPKLLARDQLYYCHRYAKPIFAERIKKEKFPPEEAKRRRLIWQRREVRNNKFIRDSDGNFIGFGVLTGESSALDFVEIRCIDLKAKDRIILATDALSACIETGEEEETISHYSEILAFVKGLPSEDAAQRVLEHIRNCEDEKNLRSDDATVIIVDIV